MIEVPTMDTMSHVVERNDDKDGKGVDEVEEGEVEEDKGQGGEMMEVGLEEPKDEELEEPRRSKHERRSRVRDDNDRYFKTSYNRSIQPQDDVEQVGACYVYMAQSEHPRTYNEAMNRFDSDSWLEACQDELLSLRETRTYVPVSTEKIEAKNIVGCRWVFTIKRGADGSVE
jgi:hypothetical protein